MAAKNNPDLHGSAPDEARDALLILDMISRFEFKDGARMFKRALPVANRIARLRDRATAAHVPVIYVNDNEGRWRSDFRGQFEASVRKGSRGAANRDLAKTASNRLLHTEAETLGILCDSLGNIARTSRYTPAHSYRHLVSSVRVVYRERCLCSRLQARRAAGLHRCRKLDDGKACPPVLSKRTGREPHAITAGEFLTLERYIRGVNCRSSHALHFIAGTFESMYLMNSGSYSSHARVPRSRKIA